ncbi:glycine cleavage system aminomethyltransferase GcvT [Alicyclobacillaceae bacterium I2511]|nr:glycine cleavage system aminomethyltransferase GcvT [Alicyclobacillaceae bacterium I2511]
MTFKRTPLYPLYAQSSGKIVEFGGWDMPVQFSSILKEHQAVRNAVGLFDAAHMGEFFVTGADASAFLQNMVTNDVSRLHPGEVLYSPMTYDDGGTVDDLLVYCLAADQYQVVVNASNIDKDFAWLKEHTKGKQLTLTDRSEQTALLAVQGPSSQTLLQRLTDTDLSNIAYYHFTTGTVAGLPALISRTGYTGEDGFELYVDATAAPALWETLLNKGQDLGILPCGLGARDTLRLEARLPLYGHELSSEITPLEAGLGIFVKLNKESFVGQQALAEQKAAGLQRKVVGFVLTQRGIPRPGYTVSAAGQVIGHVTSGTLSPTLNQPIGLALVNAKFAAVGTPFTVDIRGKAIGAQVVKTPFYKRDH